MLGSNVKKLVLLLGVVGLAVALGRFGVFANNITW